MKIKHSELVINWWRSLDHQSLFIVSLMMAMSIILIATASPAVALRIGVTDSYFIEKHLLYSTISFLLMLIISSVPKKWLHKLAFISYIATLLFLIATILIGSETKGSRRWINIFGLSLQPSEFMKPVLAIITAWFLTLRYKRPGFPGVSLATISYIFVALLLLLQPDFGMLVTTTAIWLGQLFLAGLPVYFLSLGFIAGLVFILGAYLSFPHVAARINSFLFSEVKENYQINKSLQAFGKGGFYGIGPGEGTVKQVLPDSHTDFIFAVIGEEFGAFLGFIIIILYSILILRGLFRLADEHDYFTILSCSGILIQLGFQSIINIGVSLNLFPTKGMTLPFISYGGSSSIALAVGFGFYLSLTRYKTNIRSYKFKFEELE
jgi:cell division protein FtsW